MYLYPETKVVYLYPETKVVYLYPKTKVVYLYPETKVLLVESSKTNNIIARFCLFFFIYTILSVPGKLKGCPLFQTKLKTPQDLNSDLSRLYRCVDLLPQPEFFLLFTVS